MLTQTIVVQGQGLEPLKSKAKGGNPPKPVAALTPTALARVCLPQQGQHALGQLVGLRHHGGAGLLQDLRARQVGGF